MATTVAWRRLGREPAAHLRRRVSPPPLAPARTFSASPVANPTQFLGRNGQLGIWSRYSSPALQARAPKLGAFLVQRMRPGNLPRLSGRKLLTGFGTSAAVAMMLYPKTIAHADEVAERPSERPSECPSDAIRAPSLRFEISQLWPLIRKYQLPAGLIVVVAFGWQNPLGLLINVLLLLYSSRPSPYSIYLFLHEIHHREMRLSPALWKNETVSSRKVNAKDYKFYSFGTIELPDRKVLHVIGILGSWWIYRISYNK